MVVVGHLDDILDLGEQMLALLGLLAERLGEHHCSEGKGRRDRGVATRGHSRRRRLGWGVGCMSEQAEGVRTAGTGCRVARTCEEVGGLCAECPTDDGSVRAGGSRSVYVVAGQHHSVGEDLNQLLM